MNGMRMKMMNKVRLRPAYVQIRCPHCGWEYEPEDLGVDRIFVCENEKCREDFETPVVLWRDSLNWWSERDN